MGGSLSWPSASPLLLELHTPPGRAAGLFVCSGQQAREMAVSLVLLESV